MSGYVFSTKSDSVASILESIQATEKKTLPDTPVAFSVVNHGFKTNVTIKFRFHQIKGPWGSHGIL